MVTETLQAAFERGQAVGKRDARLDGHDDRLAANDAELVTLHEDVKALVVAVTELTLAVQLLGAEARARDEKALALAVALKDAKEVSDATTIAETAKNERSWSPAAKVIGILGAVAVLWTLLTQVFPV